MKQNITNAELEFIRLDATEIVTTSIFNEVGGEQLAPGRRGAYDDYDNEEEEW